MTNAQPGAREKRPTGRIVLATAVLPILIAVAGSATLWTWRDELPAPMAVHWGADGVADGFGSPIAMIAVMLGFSVLFGALALVLSTSTAADPVLVRVAAGTAAGTTALVTALLVALSEPQRGMADAAGAVSPASSIALSVGVAALAAVVAVLLVPRWTPSGGGPVPADAPRVTVGPDERVVWTRSVATGSLPAAIIVVGVGVTAIIGILGRQWLVLGLAAAMAILAALMFSIRVTVDASGVTVKGGFGRPRIHTPLAEISHASVAEVHPIRHFGGYGYRIASFGPLRGASGFVLRGGTALVLERHAGRRTLVVVEDADVAAGLVNALVERANESNGRA